MASPPNAEIVLVTATPIWLVTSISNPEWRRLGPYAALCAAANMEQERRALRFTAHDLSCVAEPQGVVLRFRLGRGCFATTLLRELISTPEEGEPPPE